MREIEYIFNGLYVCAGLLCLLTPLLFWWFWFVVKRPERWGALVDAENDFWVRNGFVSVAASQRFKSWEKGLPFKVLMGVVAFLSLSTVFLILGFTFALLSGFFG